MQSATIFFGLFLLLAGTFAEDREHVTIDSKTLTINLHNVMRSTLKIVLIQNPTGEIIVSGSNNRVRVYISHDKIRKHFRPALSFSSSTFMKRTQSNVIALLGTFGCQKHIAEKIVSEL